MSHGNSRRREPARRVVRRRSKWPRPGRLLYGAYAVTAGLAWIALIGVLLLVAPGADRRRRIGRFGVRALFFLVGIPLEADGLAHLPAGTCVAVANHRSYLDGPALIAALPPRFSPVIKAEFARVPVVAAILRRAGARFVRRTPVAAAGRDTAALLARLRAGESLAMFPEGTCSVDAGLLPFREGAFFLAAKAGVPVVPITIEGTQAVLPLGRRAPRWGRVHVEASAPLRPAGARRCQSRALRGRTETAYWRDPRPATGRGSPDGRYYRRIFAGCAPPFAYLDLDRLTRRLRGVRENARPKRLRLDARARPIPALVDRVLRSEPRLTGALCASPAQALALAENWRDRDIIVAAPTIAGAELERLARAITARRALCLGVAAAPDVEAAAAVAARRRVTLALCVMLGTTSADGVSAAALADLLSLLDLIERTPRVVFHGVLEQQRPRAARPPTRTAERPRAELRAALAARGYAKPLYSVCDSAAIAADARDPAITEIVVGRALFAPRAEDAGAWPVAGYLGGDADCQSATAENLFSTAPNAPAHGAKRTRLLLVQGGAWVGQIALPKTSRRGRARSPRRRRRR